MATNGMNGDAGPVGGETINTEIITLTRFLTEEQHKHKEATGDFTSVLAILWILTMSIEQTLGFYATPCSSLSRALHTIFDAPL